jgi:hypothetical protein
MPDSLVNALVQVGVLGPVLAWMMIRHDAKIERMVEAVQNLTRAISLEVATRPGVVERLKQEAHELIEKANGK